MSDGAVAVPLAALLPPLDDPAQCAKAAEDAARARLGFDARPSAQETPLPKFAAILGPLPPSAPLSVAASFLVLADLAPFHSSSGAAPAAGAAASPPAAQPAPPPPALPQPRPHVLVLTGPRAPLHLALEEQDAPFLRAHAYALFDSLARTDIRYAPSAAHLRLLLSVLGAEGAGVTPPPSLLVLYDVMGLLTVPEERDENAPMEEEGWVEGEEREMGRVVRPGVTLGSYLDIVAAALELARAAGDIPLLILEPGGDVMLPLIAAASENVPASQSTRTALLSAGLRRLGVEVGFVARLKDETEFAGQRTKGGAYELAFGGEVYPFSRRVGAKSEFACPPRGEGEELEEGGWVWEWT